jgi:protein-tyrosine phosphatase
VLLQVNIRMDLPDYQISMHKGNHNNIIKRRLSERYGSRRGMVLSLWSGLLYRLGCYRDYEDVDWSSVERLVFVCKGNICRSAFAEAVAQSLGLESASCGIDTVDGDSANEDAIRTAASKGFNLEVHKTKKITSLDIGSGDLLIAMEPWQARHMNKAFGNQCGCTLLGLWIKPVSPHIEDPFGCSNAYFERCFGYIEKSVYEISRKLRKAKVN